MHWGNGLRGDVSVQVLPAELEGPADLYVGDEGFQALVDPILRHPQIDRRLRNGKQGRRNPGFVYKSFPFLGDFGRGPTLKYGWTDHGGLVKNEQLSARLRQGDAGDSVPLGNDQHRLRPDFRVQCLAVHQQGNPVLSGFPLLELFLRTDRFERRRMVSYEAVSRRLTLFRSSGESSKSKMLRSSFICCSEQVPVSGTIPV